MAVQAVPGGYRSVQIYLWVDSAEQAMNFYARAFGAVETMRLSMGDGSIAHAEVQIGDSIVMLSDVNPEWGNLGPKQRGGPTSGICFYTPNCDAVVAKAVAEGGTLMRPVQDQFYGDRSGTILDPFGHQWTIATHTEDIPPAEMQVRMDAWVKSMEQG